MGMQSAFRGVFLLACASSAWALGPTSTEWRDSVGNTCAPADSMTTVPLWAPVQLNAVHGRSRPNGGAVVTNKDIWAVGKSGNILYFNGANWNQQASPTTETLRAVYIYPANITVGGDQVAGWAAGDHGTVLRLTENLPGAFAWKCENCPLDCGPPAAVGGGGALKICATIYDIFPSDPNDGTTPVFFTGQAQCLWWPDNTCQSAFGDALTLFSFMPPMTAWTEATGTSCPSVPYSIADLSWPAKYECSTGVDYTGIVTQVTGGMATAGGVIDSSWYRLTCQLAGSQWKPYSGPYRTVACPAEPAFYTSALFGKWVVVMGDSEGTCLAHPSPSGAIVDATNMFVYNQYSGGAPVFGIRSGLAAAKDATWGTVRKLASLSAWGFGIGVGHGRDIGASALDDRTGLATTSYFALVKWTDTNKLVKPEDPTSPNLVIYEQDPVSAKACTGAAWPGMNGVFISAYNEAWAVGESGKILHWTGPVVPPAKLEAALSVSPTGAIPTGSWFDVVLTVTNTGGAGLANFFKDLAIFPPAAAELVCGPFCSTIWCDLTSPCPTSLPPGGPAYFTWTYSMSGCGTGVSFTASVSGLDLLMTQNTWTQTGYNIGAPPLALSVTIWHSPVNVSPGDALTYTIVVTNTAAATASNPLIVDTLPPGLLGVGLDGPPGFLPGGIGTGTVYWDGTGSTIPIGVSLTFTVTGTVPAQCGLASFGNSAWARADDGCGGLAQKASAQTLFTVPGLSQPALSVTVYYTPAFPQPGMPVVYSIVVANTGSTTINNLIVVDTMPSVLLNPKAWAPTPPLWSLPPQVKPGATLLVWGGSGISFLPGTSLTFSATATVPSACAGTAASNLAWATGTVAACGSAQAVSKSESFPIPGQLDGSISLESEQEIAGRYFLTVTLTITDTGASWLNHIFPAPDLVITPAGPETVKVGGPYPTAYMDSLENIPDCTLVNPCGVSFRWNYRSSTVTPITITAMAVGEVCPPFTNSYTGCASQGGSTCTFSASTSTFFNDSGDIGQYTLNRNLFRGRTETVVASFQLDETTEVSVVVFNSVGQKVRTLFKGTWPRRMQKDCAWDGTNDDGERVASGAYFVRIESPKFVKTKKVALVK